jgi:hypothetical protein
LHEATVQLGRPVYLGFLLASSGSSGILSTSFPTAAAAAADPFFLLLLSATAFPAL